MGPEKRVRMAQIMKKHGMPGQGIYIYLTVSKANEGLSAWKRYDEIHRSMTFAVVRQMDWRCRETVRSVRWLLTHPGERFAWTKAVTVSMDWGEDWQMKYFEGKTGSAWRRLGIRWVVGLWVMHGSRAWGMIEMLGVVHQIPRREKLSVRLGVLMARWFSGIYWVWDIYGKFIEKHGIGRFITYFYPFWVLCLWE